MLFQQKLSSLDNSEDIYEDPLPPMPNNVFGLNHSEIMECIQKSKQKSRGLHRLQPEDAEKAIPQLTNENPIQFASTHEEKEAFREFLHQRQVSSRMYDILWKCFGILYYYFFLTDIEK